MLDRRTLLVSAAALMAASSVSYAGGHGRLGKFKGASNHITTGSVEVYEEGGKTYVELGDDFTFDGAPDPKVALGANGYDARTLMGKLRSNTGKQRYEVPAGIDAAKYNEVWIWCEKFAVPLGVAGI